MKKTRFQIGQTVKITNTGHRYPGYREMAEKMGLTKWMIGKMMRQGDYPTIVAVVYDDSNRKTLYGVELGGQQEIYSESGFLASAIDCDPTSYIHIDRDTLNSYWDAATTSQREYMNNHFQLDGTTTIAAIRGLRDIACDAWKKVITSNHSEVFPEYSKYFDLAPLLRDGGRHNTCVFTCEQEKAAGVSGVIMIANAILDGKYRNKGFYLSDNYNWEFHETDGGGWVVVPTKRGK